MALVKVPENNNSFVKRIFDRSLDQTLDRHNSLAKMILDHASMVEIAEKFPNITARELLVKAGKDAFPGKFGRYSRKEIANQITAFTKDLDSVYDHPVTTIVRANIRDLMDTHPEISRRLLQELKEIDEFGYEEPDKIFGGIKLNKDLLGKLPMGLPEISSHLEKLSEEGTIEQQLKTVEHYLTNETPYKLEKQYHDVWHLLLKTPIGNIPADTRALTVWLNVDLKQNSLPSNIIEGEFR